jgi:hypothetical protein
VCEEGCLRRGSILVESGTRCVLFGNLGISYIGLGV